MEKRGDKVIPRTLKVAGVDYDIRVVDEIENNRNNMGVTLHQKSVIQIKRNMSEDKQEQAFIHELLHACFYEAGYKEFTEDMINRVGTILHQVLRDNDILLKNDLMLGGCEKRLLGAREI